MFRVTETIMANVTQNPNSNPYPKPSNQTVENGRCHSPERAPERMGEIDSAPYLTLCPMRRVPNASRAPRVTCQTYDFHARIELVFSCRATQQTIITHWVESSAIYEWSKARGDQSMPTGKHINFMRKVHLKNTF